MRIALVLAALTLAACAVGPNGERPVTVYLEARLGPDGPPGQIAPVLEPARRPPRPGLAPAVHALVLLRQGPTPEERAGGMRAPVDRTTRLRLARVESGTAFVEVSGRPLDPMGLAAVVYSLTELPEVARVRVCCRPRHDGSAVTVHTRASFRGWSAEPCTERREHRCVRDG